MSWGSLVWYRGDCTGAGKGLSFLLRLRSPCLLIKDICVDLQKAGGSHGGVLGENLPGGRRSKRRLLRHSLPALWRSLCLVKEVSRSPRMGWEGAYLELWPCCTSLKNSLVTKPLSIKALSHLQDSGDPLKTPSSQLSTKQKDSRFVWVLINSLAFGEQEQSLGITHNLN